MPVRHRPLRTFTLDRPVIRGLETLRQRDGIPASEAVRRALRLWLARRGVEVAASTGSAWPGPPRDGLDLPPEWDFRDPDPSPPPDPRQDLADLELISRALRRLRVRPADEDRRRRLILQIDAEIRALEIG